MATPEATMFATTAIGRVVLRSMGSLAAANVAALTYGMLGLGGGGGMGADGQTWAWVLRWMEPGGFDPAPADCGACGGVIHGIAFRPKPPSPLPAGPTT